MGGLGSTRWQNYDRRLTVEECPCLFTTDLFRYPLPTETLGQVDWTDKRTGNIIAFMFYRLDVSDLTNQRLFTNVHRKFAEGVKDQVEWIRLEATPWGRYGGVRWWFRCPSPNGSGLPRLFRIGSTTYFSIRLGRSRRGEEVLRGTHTTLPVLQNTPLRRPRLPSNER